MIRHPGYSFLAGVARRVRPRSFFALVAIAFALVILSVTSLPAHAVGIPANLGASFFGTDGANDWLMTPTLNVDSADGSFSFDALDQDRVSFSVENVLVSGNVDPVISASFSVVNNTGLPQDYTFIFTIPIVAQTPATLTGGSTGITITDTNGNGATLGTHTNLRPTYFSQIDGADWASLTLSPLVEPNPFESEAGTGLFGTPIPSLAGPAALASIGIRYDFSLTAGDRAAVTGVFVVEAIPEPTTCLLAVAGLLACVSVRRRS